MTFRPIAGHSHALTVLGALVLASCSSGTEPDPPNPADARRPTITITSPSRGAMLMSGTYDPSPVAVTGEACHESQPIASLTINGVAQAVAGDARCETFSTMVDSPWGLSTVTVVARNALGREATHVQSWLRGPEYYPPLLTADPAGRIANAALFRFNATGVTKLQAITNALAPPFSLGTALPSLLIDAEPAQPICVLGGRPVTRTGYRVTRGAVAFSTVNAASVITTANTMRQDVQFLNIVVPLTVTGYRKTSCEAVETATITGSMTVQSVIASTEIGFAIAAGGVATSMQIVNSAATTTSVNLDVSATFLTTNDRDEMIASIVPFVTDALEDEVGVISRERFAREYGRFVTGAHLPEQRLSAIGLDLVHAANLVAFQSGGQTIGFGAQVMPQTPRSGAPPERGGIRTAMPGWPSLNSFADVSYIVSDDLLNQIFWAAWQAGRLDEEDVMGTAAGLSVSIRSLLPPVITRNSANRVRIGWGDAQLDAVIDPAIFGSAEETSTTPVTVRAYATTILDAALAYDSLAGAFALNDVQTDIALQVDDAPDVSLNETVVAAAIRAAVNGAVRERVAAIIAATPVASVALTGFDGLPDAFQLPVWFNGLTRDSNFDRIDGRIVVPTP